MQQAQQLLKGKTKIIDLSPDFRLKDINLWQETYQQQHANPELIKEAVYGLPELNRAAIAKARLVANPGCYPTAITLGFMPLLAQQLVDIDSLVADAKSGVSGAGRQAKQNLLYSEVAETFKAYGLPKHRHAPEIQQSLSQISGKHCECVFVPHLLPMGRGIHATLHGRLVDSKLDLQALFEKHYQNEPFIDVMPAGSHPATHTVSGSNLCRIAVFKPSKDRFVVLSVIDNLIKGAAGQAVQNLNILFGLDEATGLKAVPRWPESVTLSGNMNSQLL